MKGARDARARLVDRLGDQLLARARLALDQDRGLRRRDLLHLVDQVLEHGGIPDDAAKAELIVQALVELLDLDLEGLRLEGPPDQDVEPLDVDGLGQEIDRPALHRLDRGVDVP